MVPAALMWIQLQKLKYKEIHLELCDYCNNYLKTLGFAVKTLLRRIVLMQKRLTLKKQLQKIT